MKKNYLLILTVLFNAVLLNAQSRINKKLVTDKAYKYENKVINNRNSAQALYQLPNTNPCFTDSMPVLYTYGGGYYGETQKAQLFHFDQSTYPNATIDSVRAAVYTTANHNVGTNVYATLYAFDTTIGDVGQVLGVSEPLLLSSAYNTFPYAKFHFNTPVNVPANGFVLVSVSIPNYAAGDTLLVFSSNPALFCTESVLNAWEQYPIQNNPDYWAPIAYSWGGGDPTAGPNCDWHIFPKVTWGSGTAVFVDDMSEDNIKIFPNPTNGMLVVENAKDNVLNVYNTMGAVMFSTNIKNNNVKLDLSKLAKGNYMLVSSKDGIVTGKQLLVRN